MPAWVTRVTSDQKKVADVSEKPGEEWVGTPLDAVDPRGIVEITVEFDEGKEVLTPKLNERFGS
jgi:hypothetical protein